MKRLPKSGTGPSKVRFVLLAIAIFIICCLGAELLDLLAGKVFGWR